jgi:undecaprenyl-diphosphatase
MLPFKMLRRDSTSGLKSRAILLSAGGTVIGVMAFLGFSILIWGIAFLTRFLFLGAWILAIVTIAAVLVQQRFQATIATENKATWTAGLQAATVAIPLFVLFLDAPLSKALAQITSEERMAFHMLGDFGDSAYYLYPLGIAGLALTGLAFWDKALAVRPMCRRVLPYIGFAFSAIALSGIAAILLKILIGRARPRVLLSEDWYGIDPIGLASSYQSFPSGHATTAFTVAFVVAFLWPRLLYPAMAVAVSVALCRVAVNAHFLSDIIAGGILAAVVTSLLRAEFARRGLLFKSVANSTSPKSYPQNIPTSPQRP